MVATKVSPTKTKRVLKNVSEALTESQQEHMNKLEKENFDISNQDININPVNVLLDN